MSYIVNSVIFKLQDELVMATLDENYILSTDVIEFSTMDDYYEDIDDSQLVLANINEDGTGSYELARYTIFGPDDEASPISEVIADADFQSIIHTLVNSYNHENKMKMH